MENIFKKFYEIDVSEHIEKKGKFSYLSWPFAVAEMRKADPTATWEVMRFDGKPFMQNECGYFVEVSVTIQGVSLSQIHPVLDNSNKPISAPNSFQINTSIQRCLVKAIALHGLGLYIYAGEDLPIIDAEVVPPPSKNPPTASKKDIDAFLVQLSDHCFGIEADMESWVANNTHKRADLETVRAGKISATGLEMLTANLTK